MKTVKVVTAVICNSMEEKKEIFATARGYGELKGQWEFPGGMILLILVYTFFTRMFDLMLPLVAKYSIVDA